MAFDGVFAHKISTELTEAVDCHIDKIYQPSRDELVLLLRKKGYAKRLLISARNNAARIHFTESKPENPENPPMFCMLARKYFSSARLVNVFQKELERIIELIFETTNEMGDRVLQRIVCELIGNQSNIILVSNEGKIIDAVHRSDIESKRLILPGAIYNYPDSFDKLNPLEADCETVTQKIFENGEALLSKALLESVMGLSPVICRELAIRINGNDDCVYLCNREKAFEEIEKLFSCIKNGGVPFMLIEKDGKPKDFSYTEINQYEKLYEKKFFSSYSQLLEAFYTERENKARIERQTSDIKKAVNNLLSRAQKRLSVRLTELKNGENREEMRIYGELLKANLYSIKAGSKYAVVKNYYDENLSSVKIPLDPSVSPAENASRYFKEYKKSYTAKQTLSELVIKDREEIDYFETVLESISKCTCSSDIYEIKRELWDSGFIKEKNQKKKKNTQKPKLKEYVSEEGYKIIVGKNNFQNDYITTKLAAKNDIWFHTKNIHGSHVVIFCGGNEVSEKTLMFAAKLAAENSKAGKSSNVPVDYTEIKNVKKPSGSKPGMVIYSSNKTLYVTPEVNSL